MCVVDVGVCACGCAGVYLYVRMCPLLRLVYLLLLFGCDRQLLAAPTGFVVHGHPRLCVCVWV